MLHLGWAEKCWNTSGPSPNPDSSGWSLYLEIQGLRMAASGGGIGDRDLRGA